MLAPWKKSYNKPRQHIKKQRHYFADISHLVKVMVFPVVMYGCESWTIKKAECQRIDAFELWYWKRLEKAMAPHSSILAWRIPGMGEPGGLPSMGSHRVGHD